MKKAISILLSCCMIACSVPNIAFGASATMTVDTSTVVNTVSDRLFGVGTDWSLNHPAVSVNAAQTAVSPNPNFLKAMNEYTLPLVRIGEGATSNFDWEKAIGNYSSRPNQSLWGYTGKVAAGPKELAEAFEQVDPNVGFTFTVDVLNSNYASKAAHYAQFLRGGANTVYGQKRIAMGHSEPINVVLYELGNEPDWNTALTGNVSEYMKRCKEIIAAVKAVDPEAEFAVNIDTSIYQAFNNPSTNPYDEKAAWHRAILADSELMQNISYLALHSYYGYNDSLMEKLITQLESDISGSAYPNTKIYISEHALAYFDYTGDGVADTKPSAMEGTIETAFTLQRLMSHKGVGMATYHALSSSAWKNIWINGSTGEIQLNSTGQLLNLFKEYGTGELLSSTYSGYSADADSSAYGVAVRDSSGNINLIFTNNTSAEQAVTVSLSGTEEYVISDETKIVSNGDLSNEITVTSNGITIKKYDYNKDTVFSGSYSVPAYSVCAVRLSPKMTAESTQKVLFSENFNTAQDYTMPDGWKTMSGRMVSYVEDGALIVKSDDYYNPQYVRIGGLSQMKKAGLTVEADVTLLEQNDAARNDGARNKAGFAFVNGEKYSTGGLLTFANQSEFSESGNANLTQGVVSYSAGEEFSSKTPVKLKLVFTDAAKGPDVYVNGVKQTYYNKTSTNTENGSLCLMVLAATVKFDNIVVTGEKNNKLSASDFETSVKNFEYVQNFDSFADGSLPAGWTLYRNKSSNAAKTIKAEVRNGALELTDNNQYSNGYVIFDIPELADVNLLNLDMECDVTLGNSLGLTVDNKASDCVGFVYGFDESLISAANITTDSSGVKIINGGGHANAANRLRVFTNRGDTVTMQEVASHKLVNTTPDVRDSTGFSGTVPKINTAGGDGKLKLRMYVDPVTQHPRVFFNGEEVSYTRGPYFTPYKLSGKIGLLVADAAVTIDNIKVTGQREETVLNPDSYLTLGASQYDSASQTYTISVDAVKADLTSAEQPAIMAAVYGNDNRLEAIKMVDVSGTDRYCGSITIEGVSAEPAQGHVKVFWWDMSTVSPITSATVK